MHTILIAIDYNPTAQKVVEIGNEIATALQANIHLLHVINSINYYNNNEYSPVMGFTGFSYNVNTLQNVTEYITVTAHEFLIKTKSHLNNNTINTIVKDGPTADSILEVAKDINATMIIVGSHSRRWLEKILIGSTAEKVIQQSTVPVLTIPTKKTSDT